MLVLTSAIALLVSLAGLVFALLVFVENRRLQRETHRAAALSATHTATLLTDEAADLLRRTDALLEAASLEPDSQDARGYDAYRRTLAEDRAALAKAMSQLAYGNPAVIECRAMAARSSLITQRTIAGRKVLLQLLTSLRAVVAALPHGDTASPPTLGPVVDKTPPGAEEAPTPRRRASARPRSRRPRRRR